MATLIREAKAQEQFGAKLAPYVTGHWHQAPPQFTPRAIAGPTLSQLTSAH